MPTFASQTRAPFAPPAPIHTTAQPERTAPLPERDRPLLLLFVSRQSGQARRVEGYIAHVLQRRHNHDSFRFRIVEQEARPDLFARLGVNEVPTILVVDGHRVCRRLKGYVRPNEVETALQPWLH